MTKFTSTLAAALALSTLAAPLAVAHEFKAGTLSIKHPWSRETAPRAKTGAGYLTIINTGGQADRFLGGTTPAAEKLEIHAVSMDNGIMRMRPQPNGVEVPANGKLELKPGSYHLMLVGLKAPLKAGESIPATLEFAKAGKVEVSFKVETLAYQPAPASDHGKRGEAEHHGNH
ncbi:copper chaperone PCu(A)C [Pedomonas mirosovicensis]|uniref:copper chaperone PCu(A)C n=1 Tax=Pedomonas mirosovicensis TaxID=2908641 RepID=UPI00216A21CA|nr:copper chaperone PCu(A)C [Pedomonas mirosovicensis]MCH8686782.1 copper chaperone PCu(A)C [Pedomonas mirosovicensis]